MEISVLLKHNEGTSWSSLSTIGVRTPRPHQKAIAHVTFFVHCLIVSEVLYCISSQDLDYFVILYPFPIHSFKMCPLPLREGISHVNATHQHFQRSSISVSWLFLSGISGTISKQECHLLLQRCFIFALKIMETEDQNIECCLAETIFSFSI